MSTLRSPTRRIAPLALILSLLACDERSPSTPPSGATPAGLRVLGGDGQQAPAGAALPDELVVTAVDAAGRPIPGIPVQFSVVAGGGEVAPQAVTSDGRGSARTRWTLGTVAADSQVVEARADGVPSLRLRAHARPGAPSALAMAGGGGVGPVGAALADSLAVAVKDRFGNPVEGIAVGWEVAAGGGTVAPSRALTRADGTARAQWILGPRVDSAQTVLARVPGFEPAAFVAHAVTRGAPLQLAKRGGDGQRGPAGGVLADSISVVLRMPDGRPVPGATVTWSAPADAGVVLPAVSRTDADGVASAAWRLGTRPGLAQAAAAVDEGTLLFTAGIESAAPVRVEAAGGSTEGPVGAPLADSLAVRVADAFGNPVAGVEVAWTRDWGGGAVTPAQGRTDAAGVARAQWTLGPFAGPPGQAASATVQGLPPVRFRATATTRGVPLQLVRVGGDAQVAEVGTMLPDSLAVRLLTQAGAPVQGAAIAWAVVTGGGRVSPATSRTDPQGFARAAWTLGTRVRNARASATLDDAVLTFTAVPRPGPAATVHAHRGNGQSATRGTILDDSLVARVTDVYGNAVRGVKVRWMVTAGGGLLEDDTSVTPPNGLVRTRWALGVAPGENAVAAVVDGAAEGRFTATALPGTLTLRAWRHSGQHWRISATRHDLRAYVEAAVTDAGGRRAVTALVTLDDNHGQPLPWGPPLLRFLPRPPATLTATFNPMEMPLPYAVARFEGQRVEVVGVPVWDFYDLRLSVVPTAPKYYANDTVHVDLRMTYRFPADAPPSWEPVAPVRFESGGWVAESDTRAGADWPLGPELGSRRIYACVMMGGATCTSTFVSVVARP